MSAYSNIIDSDDDNTKSDRDAGVHGGLLHPLTSSFCVEGLIINLITHLLNNPCVCGVNHSLCNYNSILYCAQQDMREIRDLRLEAYLGHLTEVVAAPTATIGRGRERPNDNAEHGSAFETAHISFLESCKSYAIGKISASALIDARAKALFRARRAPRAMLYAAIDGLDQSQKSGYAGYKQATRRHLIRKIDFSIFARPASYHRDPGLSYPTFTDRVPELQLSEPESPQPSSGRD